MDRLNHLVLCSSGFCLCLANGRTGRGKKVRWQRSLVSCILSSQATDASGRFLLIPLLLLGDFSPLLQVCLNSVNNSYSLSLHVTPTPCDFPLLPVTGYFTITFWFFLILLILLKIVPSLTSLVILPVCAPFPARSLIDSTQLPWQHHLLVLLEPFCSFSVSFLSLPLRCWCAQDSSWLPLFFL